MQTWHRMGPKTTSSRIPKAKVTRDDHGAAYSESSMIPHWYSLGRSKKFTDPSDAVTQMRCLAIFDRRMPAYATHLSFRILPRRRRIFLEDIVEEHVDSRLALGYIAGSG